MWVLSGVTGLLNNIDLHVGKDGCEMQNGEPDYGEASHAVVRLCPHISLAVKHKVFYDNFSSRIPLPTYFAKKRLHSVVTVHTNSLADYKPLPGKQTKKCGRGTMIEKTAIADGLAIHAVLRYDKRMVSLVSMYCEVQTGTKVRRFFKYDKV